MLKSNNYDCVHIHADVANKLLVSAFAAKCVGLKKIIVHSHSTGLSKSLKHYVLRMITNPILSMCPTHYLACSVDAGVWKFPASVVRGKLQIINNGIDLNLFAPDETKRLEYRKMLDISDKTMVIGNVGRFSYVKNQEFLIEIVSQLKQRRKNIKLIVAPGEYEDDSQGMISFSTADFFRHIHADKVFLSTQGVNDLGELTAPEMTDAHVKQALMRAGRQKILLADSSKFGQTFLAGHARLADLDLVISQTGLSPDILSLMQTQNVPLLLADSHL